MKDSRNQLDAVYSFIEKYFYFIVGAIVLMLISLSASLYSQNIPNQEANGVVVSEIEMPSCHYLENNYMGNCLAKSLGSNAYNKRDKVEKECSLESGETTIFNPSSSIGKNNQIDNVMQTRKTDWSMVAKKYKLEMRSAKPNFT